MIVYHFLAAEFALRALRDRRVKIARLNELNDPWDFYTADSFDDEVQLKLEAFRDQANERYGAVCFCAHYHDPVLWSHYADGHRGVALVFDIPDDDAIPVDYQCDRRDLNVDAALARGCFDQSDVNQLVSAKFASWRYEQEIRMTCALSDHFCQIDAKGKKVYFESLRLESYGTDALRLIGLIRGVRCYLSQADIASEMLAVDTLQVQDARLERSSGQVVAGERYSVSGERSFTACCFRI